LKNDRELIKRICHKRPIAAASR